MEIDTLNKVINHWKEEDILSTNSQSTFVNVALSENKIVIPSDFIKLYKESNGTSDYDSESFKFYQYGELITMTAKFSLSLISPLNEVIIFADYMQESWWYGFRVNKHGYEIGIIPEANTFKVISNSLFEFLNLYLSDSSKLYDYN